MDEMHYIVTKSKISRENYGSYRNIFIKWANDLQVNEVLLFRKCGDLCMKGQGILFKKGTK